MGFVDCAASFAPLLRAAFPDLQLWPRVIFGPLAADLLLPPIPAGVRRLAAADTHALGDLEPPLTWISNTWGGPANLASSGYAWGAFVDGGLAAVAATGFLDWINEDIGVVTNSQFQRRGLSTARAAALCRDICARGHQPIWETSTDNTASLRVAAKLGFQVDRHDIRVTPVVYDPAQEEALQRVIDEQLIPAFQRLPGFVSYTAGLDRNAQRGISITTWDNMEHAAGLRTALGAVIQQLERVGVRFELAQVYELTAQA